MPKWLLQLLRRPEPTVALKPISGEKQREFLSLLDSLEAPGSHVNAIQLVADYMLRTGVSPNGLGEFYERLCPESRKNYNLAFALRSCLYFEGNGKTEFVSQLYAKARENDPQLVDNFMDTLSRGYAGIRAE